MSSSPPTASLQRERRDAPVGVDVLVDETPRVHAGREEVPVVVGAEHDGRSESRRHLEVEPPERPLPRRSLQLQCSRELAVVLPAGSPERMRRVEREIDEKRGIQRIVPAPAPVSYTHLTL